MGRTKAFSLVPSTVGIQSAYARHPTGAASVLAAFAPRIVEIATSVTKFTKCEAFSYSAAHVID
jgi:hypothetical protein